MRIVTAALTALVVSPAAAQPVTSPNDTCEVRFVRAPDDVRHVIETWLAAEPRCTSSIELRVIPTDDGYYLLAQRSDGRIHERLVPDAQSAGVLVASWVADDWTETPPRAPRVDRAVVVERPERESIVRIVESGGEHNEQWIALSGMIRAGGGGGEGARAELDLISRGAWSLGAAVSLSESTDTAEIGYSMPPYVTKDFKLMGTLSRTSTFGRWQLRLSGGAGAIHTDSGLADSVVAFDTTGYLSGYPTGLSGWSPAAEVSATLSRRLGARWAVSVGPVVTFVSQDVLGWSAGTWEPDMQVAHRDNELMFVGGLRYSL